MSEDKADKEKGTWFEMSPQKLLPIVEKSGLSEEKKQVLRQKLEGNNSLPEWPPNNPKSNKLGL